MTDSPRPETLAAVRGRNDEQRLQAIHAWVRYVETNPPAVWGDQLNTLVDAQLQSARDADVPIETRRRVDRAGGTFSNGDE